MEHMLEQNSTQFSQSDQMAHKGNAASSKITLTWILAASDFLCEITNTHRTPTNGCCAVSSPNFNMSWQTLAPFPIF